MYTLLHPYGQHEAHASGSQAPVQPGAPPPLNVRASWVAGAPVHGDALLTLVRPSQVGAGWGLLQWPDLALGMAPQCCMPRPRGQPAASPRPVVAAPGLVEPRAWWCRVLPAQLTADQDLKYGGRSSAAHLTIRWRGFGAADFWRCALEDVAGAAYAKERRAPFVATLPHTYT